MTRIENRTGEHENIAGCPKSVLAGVLLHLVPHLAIRRRVLRDHIGKRKGLGHGMLVGCVSSWAKVPPIHGRLLATIVAQLAAAASGNTRVRKKVIGALFALGISQAGCRKALHDKHRGLAGLGVENRKAVRAQLAFPQTCRHFS